MAKIRDISIEVFRDAASHPDVYRFDMTLESFNSDAEPYPTVK